MKYLKPFRLLESKQEDLWELVSVDDWTHRDSKWGSDLPIDDSDKSRIRVLINSNWAEAPDFKPKYVNWSFNLSTTGNKYQIEMVPDEGYSNKKFLLLIAKTSDEWFFVKEFFYKLMNSRSGEPARTSNTWRQQSYKDVNGNSVYESYYKCDSIEGLLKLIKDRYNHLDKM